MLYVRSMASSAICYLAILSITAATAEQASVEVAADGTVQIPSGDDGLNRRRLVDEKTRLKIHVNTADGMTAIVLPSMKLDDFEDPYYEMNLAIHRDLKRDPCFVSVIIHDALPPQRIGGAAVATATAGSNVMDEVKSMPPIPEGTKVYVQLDYPTFDTFATGLRQGIFLMGKRYLDPELFRSLSVRRYTLKADAKNVWDLLINNCGVKVPSEEEVVKALQPEDKPRTKNPIMFHILPTTPLIPMYVTCLDDKSFKDVRVEIPPDGTVQALNDALKAKGIGPDFSNIVGNIRFRGLEYYHYETKLKDMGFGFHSHIVFQVQCYVNVVVFKEGIFDRRDFKESTIKVAVPDQRLKSFVNSLRTAIKGLFIKETQGRLVMPNTYLQLALPSKDNAANDRKSFDKALRIVSTKCGVNIPGSYPIISQTFNEPDQVFEKSNKQYAKVRILS